MKIRALKNSHLKMRGFQRSFLFTQNTSDSRGPGVISYINQERVRMPLS